MSWDVFYWIMMSITLVVFGVHLFQAANRKGLTKKEVHGAIYLLLFGTCVWPITLPIFLLYLLFRTRPDDKQSADRPAGRSFWAVPPISTDDPGVLYHYGIQCVARKDGPGMIATGWTLWRRAGLHRNQAKDLILDGFTEWRDSAKYSAPQGLAFLEAALKRVMGATPPPAPTDPAFVSSDVMEKASAYFSFRSAIGEWLLAEARRTGRTDLLARYEEEFRRVTVDTPTAFIPPHTATMTRAYADEHGWPPPWPAG